jgi:putative inner membrane protein
MNTHLDKFFGSIQIEKTHIKETLPFVWVFGSNKDHSFRQKFLNQLAIQSDHLLNQYKISQIEDYPNWIDYNNLYKNLVDFEKDVISISQGVIIFSESVGAFAEIGAFSCFPFLHKNLLIIAKENHVNQNNASFLNFGPILKIKGDDEESKNIWAINDDSSLSDNECQEISDHFLEVITSLTPHLLDSNLERDIILLLIDLIDLFPNRTKSFYEKFLKGFSIKTENFNMKKIFRLIQILGVVESKSSGNNTLYLIARNYDYNPCIKYTGTKNKPFDRAAFKIEMSK